MKKNIFVFIIGLIACSAIFYLVYSTDQSIDQGISKRSDSERVTKEESLPTGDQIINDQVQKLATNLEVKISEDQLFTGLNNYRVEIKDLKKGLKKDFVKKYVSSQSKKLLNCLKVDFCGMKADPDGYFDEHSTPAHVLLSRELRLLNEMLEFGELELNELDFSELIKLENKSIIESTAELFLKADPSQTDLESFIATSSHLEGAKKQTFYFKLIKAASSSQRDLLIDSLAKELKTSEAYSIVAFFQKISSLKLDESELITISKSGCHLKEDNEVSWNSFSYNFKKYVTENSFDILLDEVCP
ncbi:hypothetical protein [Halobacteriovorax marinus]|nr:hypothetical protein [Halobacteriovorax marinus]